MKDFYVEVLQDAYLRFKMQSAHSAKYFSELHLARFARSSSTRAWNFSSLQKTFVF